MFDTVSFTLSLLLTPIPTRVDWDQQRPIQTPDDSNFDCIRFQLRMTLIAPDDSGRFRTIPTDSGRLRIILSGPTFRSRFRNYRCYVRDY